MWTSPKFHIFPGYLGFAFLASNSDSNVSAVTDPIVFNTIHVNYGENYNGTTGIYTVPVNGLYEFSVQIYCVLDALVECVFYIAVDGVLTTDTAHTTYSGTTLQNRAIATSVILELSEGQQVSITPNDTNYNIVGTLNGMASWFSGHLLFAY